MATKSNKAVSKAPSTALKRQIAHGTKQLKRILARAADAGTTAKDPLWIKIVAAVYHRRPVIKGTDILVERKKIGHIDLTPVGGVRGMKVFDRHGRILVCTGSCVPDEKWSPLVKGIDLLPNLDHT